MTNRKVVWAKNLEKLTPQQRAALVIWMRDMRKALPAMEEMQRTAKAVYQALLDAPTWTIAETEKADGATQSIDQMWSVGPPQVNYVEPGTIKPISGDADASPDRRKGRKS